MVQVWCVTEREADSGGESLQSEALRGPEVTFSALRTTISYIAHKRRTQGIPFSRGPFLLGA
jgi:hypothetical protein